MTSNMSVLGLYNFDGTLFNNLSVPEAFSETDKTTLVNNLVCELAELEVLYTSAGFMKTIIGVWSAKELPTWERIYAAAAAEYNPIENYDRQELTTDQGAVIRQHSGNDVSADTGSDTSANTGTDTTTNKVAGYDSNTLTNHDSSDLVHGHTNTLTHGHTNTLTHGLRIADETGNTHTSRIHGNIGVLTSQQMLESELSVSPKLNVMNYIIESFKNRFCLLVY